MVKEFLFDTLQEAWQGINEYLAKEEKEILERGGGRYGPEIVSYNNFMRINHCWVDPEFDFGRIFGYRTQKWNSLINNYVDYDYVDLIKAEVLIREKKKSKSYNFAFHFSNSHNSGKDCLISLIFSRRITYDIPILIFHVRSSEVTKRLLFDFLLIQRIKEYVYGKDQAVMVEFYCPGCYITAENFAMYHNHKSVPKIMKKVKDPGVFQKRIMQIYREFKTVDPDTIKYKVNKRSVLQLQKGEDGLPKSGVGHMYAKDLLLIQNDGINYPEDVITERERRAHRKKLRNPDTI